MNNVLEVVFALDMKEWVAFTQAKMGGRELQVEGESEQITDAEKLQVIIGANSEAGRLEQRLCIYLCLGSWNEREGWKARLGPDHAETWMSIWGV